MADEEAVDREQMQFVLNNWGDLPPIPRFEGEDPNGPLGLHNWLSWLLRLRAPIEAYRDLLENAPDIGWEMDTNHFRALLMVLQGFMLRRMMPSMGALKFLLIKFPDLARTRMCENYGECLLHFACEYGCDIDVYKLMLEIHPEAAKTLGYRNMLPLHRAISTRQASVELVELLLSYYPDAIWSTVPREDLSHWLPLHFILEQEEEAKEVTLYLLDRYPEAAMFVGSFGQFPIHLACRKCASLEVVQRLVQIFPGGLHVRCQEGELPLHKAAVGSSLDVVKFLVELHPEHLQCRNHYRLYPLHRAAERASLAVIRFLVKIYPDAVSAAGSNGRLPLHYACGGCSPMFLETTSDVRASSTQIEVVKLLLKNYRDDNSNLGGLDIADDAGQLPLHCATEGESIEMLQFVLNRYPKAAHAADKDGNLPLHWLCFGSSRDSPFEAVRLLIDAYPFSVIQKNSDGKTAFRLVNERVVNDYVTPGLLTEKYLEVVEEIKAAVFDVLNARLGFPDLVVANVWAFAKPQL